MAKKTPSVIEPAPLGVSSEVKAETSDNDLPAFHFRDRHGNRWDATLTLAGARRIDASDFSAITSEKFSILRPQRTLFQKLLTDTPTLFAMLWAVLYPQAATIFNLDLSQEGAMEEAEGLFIDGIDGPALDAARESFWGAIASFFPEQRTALLSLLAVKKAKGKKLEAELAKLIPDMEREIDKKMEAGMAKAREELKQLNTPE